MIDMEDHLSGHKDSWTESHSILDVTAALQGTWGRWE